MKAGRVLPDGWWCVRACDESWPAVFAEKPDAVFYHGGRTNVNVQ